VLAEAVAGGPCVGEPRDVVLIGGEHGIERSVLLEPMRAACASWAVAAIISLLEFVLSRAPEEATATR